MDLTKVSARIRPRLPYEAMDLGFLMVRHWWKELFLIQVLLFGGLGALFYLASKNFGVVALLLWWFKPVIETFHLQFFGRALFDEQLHAQHILRHKWSILFHDIFAKLTWRRFNPLRNFVMPVAELEQLSRKPRHQRVRVLSRGNTGPALWMTTLGAMVETIFTLDILLMAYALLPKEVIDRIDWNQILSDEALTTWAALAMILSMFLVMPYYVACGFCFYINRRTWLEGWDIELVFKQLAHRLEKRKIPLRAGMLITGAFLTGAMLQPEQAIAGNPEIAINAPEIEASYTQKMTSSGAAVAEKAPPNEEINTKTLPTGLPADGKLNMNIQRAPAVTPRALEDSRNTVGEILEGQDYHRLERHEVLRPINENHKRTTPHAFRVIFKWFARIGEWLAQTTEVLLWASIALLLLVLARLWPRFKAKTRQREQAAETPAYSLIYGPDGKLIALPEKLTEEAQRFWREGNPREALSLLYRGALAHLIERFQLPLGSSYTEIESVELCQERCPPVVGTYFNRLTQAWMRLAYGHREVSTDEFEDLLKDWLFFHANAVAVVA